MARRFVFFVMVLAVLGLCSCAAGGSQSAQATEQSDDTAYSIAFTAWTGERNHELSLAEGDVLQVDITHARGDIRLSIHAIDGSEVYRGKGLPTSSFSVKVPSSGRHVVTVLGKDADGQVRVRKEVSEESAGREQAIVQ